MEVNNEYEKLREGEQEFYAMQGFRTDIKCHFYYDESNNCRKFWIKPKTEAFNVNPYEDFVLAGVVSLQDIEVSFEELSNVLQLQKNADEVKFNKQFSYGDFLGCMNRRRMGYLFEWINEKNLLMHYINVNNFFYAIVEIIDSIMDPTEIADMGFDYFSIKSTFYEMLRGKDQLVQNIMFKYEFPNIKREKISEFISELMTLFPPRYQQTTEQKFITGMVERAKKSDELVFLNDNTDYLMQKNYMEFYLDHPRKYYNSFHTFDEETRIQVPVNNLNNSYLGMNLDNMEYVNSKDNVLVQVSDVIAGIWAKLMIYINSKDSNSIRKDVKNLTKIQIENINMLRELRWKSCLYNKGFLMSVTAMAVIKRIDFLFDLCKAKKDEDIKMLDNTSDMKQL